jgi:hypothetical protein
LGAPYTATIDLTGPGIVRTRGSSVNDALSFVGLFGLTTNSSTYVLTFDQRFQTKGSFQTQLDQTSSGVAVQSLDNLVGRGTLSLPSSGGKTATEAFYVVAPNQFVFIDISPVSSGLNNPSNLFYVNPY